jgi:hypothetical protein
VEVRGGTRPPDGTDPGFWVRREVGSGDEPALHRTCMPVRQGRKLKGGDRENSPSSPKPPRSAPCLSLPLVSIAAGACSSGHAAPSAGDNICAAEESADFCTVQVTDDCLIAFYCHHRVDVYRAVSDFSGAGHLGW